MGSGTFTTGSATRRWERTTVWCCVGRIAGPLCRLGGACGRADQCRGGVDESGEVGGDVWEGRGCWMVDDSNRDWFPDDLTLGEVVAGTPEAADAALAAARLWAAEESERRGKLVYAVHCGA